VVETPTLACTSLVHPSAFHSKLKTLVVQSMRWLWQTIFVGRGTNIDSMGRNRASLVQE